MIWVIVVVIIAVVALASAGVALRGLPAVRRDEPSTDGRAHRRSDPMTPAGTRVLFPFMAHALSVRALDAALRLARAEGATVVAVYLARVSLDLPLDAPIARQCGVALPLQEAVEQRAARFGVPVELRIERGRSERHALRQAIARERFDQIVVAAASVDQPGLEPDDVSWLLGHAPGEIVVLRPGPMDSDVSRIVTPDGGGSGASAATGASPSRLAVSHVSPER